MPRIYCTGSHDFVARLFFSLSSVSRCFSKVFFSFQNLVLVLKSDPRRGEGIVSSAEDQGQHSEVWAYLPLLIHRPGKLLCYHVFFDTYVNTYIHTVYYSTHTCKYLGFREKQGQDFKISRKQVLDRISHRLPGPHHITSHCIALHCIPIF